MVVAIQAHRDVHGLAAHAAGHDHHAPLAAGAGPGHHAMLLVPLVLARGANGFCLRRAAFHAGILRHALVAAGRLGDRLVLVAPGVVVGVQGKRHVDGLAAHLALVGDHAGRGAGGGPVGHILAGLRVLAGGGNGLALFKHRAADVAGQIAGIAILGAGGLHDVVQRQLVRAPVGIEDVADVHRQRFSGHLIVLLQRLAALFRAQRVDQVARAHHRFGDRVEQVGLGGHLRDRLVPVPVDPGDVEAVALEGRVDLQVLRRHQGLVGDLLAALQLPAHKVVAVAGGLVLRRHQRLIVAHGGLGKLLVAVHPMHGEGLRALHADHHHIGALRREGIRRQLREVGHVLVLQRGQGLVARFVQHDAGHGPRAGIGHGVHVPLGIVGVLAEIAQLVGHVVQHRQPLEDVALAGMPRVLEEGAVVRVPFAGAQRPAAPAVAGVIHRQILADDVPAGHPVQLLEIHADHGVVAAHGEPRRAGLLCDGLLVILVIGSIQAADIADNGLGLYVHLGRIVRRLLGGFLFRL